MRYVLVFLSAILLYLAMSFTLNNPEPVILNFQLVGIPSYLSFKLPLFLTVFSSFILGMFFTMLFFAAHHARLNVRNHRNQHEIRRLKRLILKERDQSPTATENSETSK